MVFLLYQLISVKQYFKLLSPSPSLQEVDVGGGGELDLVQVTILKISSHKC